MMLLTASQSHGRNNSSMTTHSTQSDQCQTHFKVQHSGESEAVFLLRVNFIYGVVQFDIFFQLNLETDSRVELMQSLLDRTKLTVSVPGASNRKFVYFKMIFIIPLTVRAKTG